jgi:predicted site-specific integrase-resolvase
VITIAELCSRWRISRQTLGRWMAEGLVRGLKAKRAIRIELSEVERCERLMRDGRFA